MARRAIDRYSKNAGRDLTIDQQTSSSIMRGLVAVTVLLAATVATGTLDFSQFFDVRAAYIKELGGDSRDGNAGFPR